MVEMNLQSEKELKMIEKKIQSIIRRLKKSKASYRPTSARIASYARSAA